MAATAYIVSAAGDLAPKPYANLAAAKREADRRAQATGAEVEVRTQATGRLSYTAAAEPLAVVGQAEAEAALAAEDRAAALAGVAAAVAALAAARPAEADAFDALILEVKEEAGAPAAKAPRKGRREALGASVVDGWELLYDKPRQRAQVGRQGSKYALICTDHKHAHPLARLTQERGLRGGQRSVWCPSCA